MGHPLASNGIQQSFPMLKTEINNNFCIYPFVFYFDKIGLSVEICFLNNQKFLEAFCYRHSLLKDRYPRLLKLI